ncbi:MAG: BamA/TamA family outer membrane protein [Pseudomonadales bacterium]
MHPCLLLLATLLAMLSSATNHAAECSAGHGLALSDLETLNLDTRDKTLPGAKLAGTYVLRDVRYIRQNVFPRSNHWLARQANRYHLLTREGALASAFILEVGERIDETTRAEAERVLRDKPYLHAAAVLVRQICADQVDLDVVVQDVWTLTPGVAFSRTGGDNETSVSLSDTNFLGTGKSLSVEYFDDRNRSGTALNYTDPNILGSRWTGGLTYADNDDGEHYRINVGRPFFSLDTRWAIGLSGAHAQRKQDLEFLGSDLFELDAETNTAETFLARSSGRQDGWVNRMFGGVRYMEEEITYPTAFPGPSTTRREFLYPYVGWQLLEDNFVTLTNLERVGVTEDIRLGWDSYVELGWSTDSFGGEGDYLLSRGSLAYRKMLNDRHLLSVTAEGNGRYNLDQEQTEDLVLQADAEVLWYQAERWRLLTRARYAHTRNLALDRQLTLGGDAGLRGYPSRYQLGDRSFLLTVEQRYYSDAYPFGLFRLGYAAFLDVGRAWFEDEPPAWVPARDGEHFDTLSNIGVGLRLESVRTRRDRVLHIDIARPFVDGPDVKSWEITLSGKQRF